MRIPRAAPETQHKQINRFFIIIWLDFLPPNLRPTFSNHSVKFSLARTPWPLVFPHSNSPTTNPLHPRNLLLGCKSPVLRVELSSVPRSSFPYDSTSGIKSVLTVLSASHSGFSFTAQRREVLPEDAQDCCSREAHRQRQESRRDKGEAWKWGWRPAWPWGVWLFWGRQGIGPELL